MTSHTPYPDLELPVHDLDGAPEWLEYDLDTPPDLQTTLREEPPVDEDAYAAAQLTDVEPAPDEPLATPSGAEAGFGPAGPGRDVPAPAMPAGRTYLGRYRLLRPLASGRTSHVYLARLDARAEASRELTVKVLRDEHRRDPQRVRDFVDRARRFAALRHDSIPCILGVAFDCGAPYVVMDHLHGLDLRTALQRRPEGLPLDFAITVIGRCAEALDHARSRYGYALDQAPRVVACAQGAAIQAIATRSKRPPPSAPRVVASDDFDIRPSHVTACADGSVKLCKLSLDHTPELAPRSASRELAYLAPELLRGQPRTARSDVFALAVLFHELVTGEPPAVAPEQAVGGRGHARAIQVNAIAHRDDLTSELRAILAIAMASDPAERYRDGLELGRALHQLARRFHVNVGPKAVSELASQLLEPPASGRGTATAAGPVQGRDARNARGLRTRGSASLLTVDTLRPAAAPTRDNLSKTEIVIRGKKLFDGRYAWRGRTIHRASALALLVAVTALAALLSIALTVR